MKNKQALRHVDINMWQVVFFSFFRLVDFEDTTIFVDNNKSFHIKVRTNENIVFQLITKIINIINEKNAQFQICFSQW